MTAVLTPGKLRKQFLYSAIWNVIISLTSLILDLKNTNMLGILYSLTLNYSDYIEKATLEEI